MELWSLREAASRTSVSVTTLRRYIRSGRLRAEKRAGRFGPEYFVADAELENAGLPPAAPGERAAPETRPTLAAARPDPRPLEAVSRDAVPLTLYQELQLKHEQLLVQYGMMRAGGLRALELQADLEASRRDGQAHQAEIARLRERLAREAEAYRSKLRDNELEIEGRGLEIAALREKVRGLEMLTRNAVTTETIDRKYHEVMNQVRRVERLAARHDARTTDARGKPAARPEH